MTVYENLLKCRLGGATFKCFFGKCFYKANIASDQGLKNTNPNETIIKAKDY